MFLKSLTHTVTPSLILLAIDKIIYNKIINGMAANLSRIRSTTARIIKMYW